MKNGVATKFALRPPYCPVTNGRFWTVRNRELLFATSFVCPGNIALGGATANMVGYSVDGISTANIFLSAAGANPYPSSEGIADLKVTAFNNNAEFLQVGDVTFTTKAGTNNFHGNLFEYLQNDALDAKVLNFGEKAPKGSQLTRQIRMNPSDESPSLTDFDHKIPPVMTSAG